MDDYSLSKSEYYVIYLFIYIPKILIHNLKGLIKIEYGKIRSFSLGRILRKCLSSYLNLLSYGKYLKNLKKSLAFHLI